ncbi:VapE domain-containing protein [Cognatishimia maritima]|uniref:Virulence-associated protein E n=1 Tax=Cognatishimia maritima TaxID=870908 RepID=A0A1M5PJJ4_9RHOB|nr:VapE domain-containing protein [Cognatishimia maritima]SHH01669.1 Virulence-associated protein E [Cognatishimia maritima]
MAGNLKPNPSRAIEFIRWLNPEASLYLESMANKGKAAPKAKVFGPSEHEQAVVFVASGNSGETQRNMYFLPNAEYLEGTRKKTNLSCVRFLHVDLDYKDYPGTETEQRDFVWGVLHDDSKRPVGVPLPSAIWETGAGCQAVWKLEEPVSIAKAEELNKTLLHILQGGPGTHNADRLLRLPWTMNWLNDKKRAAGREPALAWHFEPMNLTKPPTTYLLSDFRVKLPKGVNNSNANGTEVGSTAIAVEPLELPDQLTDILPPEPVWIEAILNGNNPEGKTYASRSELVYAATIWMLGNGMQPGHVLSIILSPDVGISAHVLESPNPIIYAHRQVVRAMSTIELRNDGWPLCDDDGRPIRNSPQNIRYALTVLGVDAQRNTFTQTDEFRGYGLDGRDLTDIVEILSSTFQRDLDFIAAPAYIKRELLAIAHEQKYHPVEDYLDGLVWDGKPRIDKWLADYCGAEDNELNAEFGSKLLIAGVRRIKQPGVKFDTMLVLEGAQGAGKSQIAQRLAIREEWFCGSLDLKSDDKTKAEMMTRSWIVECQELDGMNKTTSQSLKKFLSTAVDMFRPAYARTASEFRRHCIILGTTNEIAYLRDLTGNRRIWPVNVCKIDLVGFSSDVDQLWAEAVVREEKGESITLSPHLWAAASNVQGQRMVEDAIADVLEDAFGNTKGRVSMDSIKLLLGVDTARMSPMDARRIKSVMAGLGWDYGTHRLHDLGRLEKAQRKGFARGDAHERKSEFIAQRLDSGLVVIVPFDTERRDEPPF